MPHPTNACPGPCNTRPRRAWDAHAQAVLAHHTAHAEWAAAEAHRAEHTPDETPTDPPTRPEPPTIAYRAANPVWCTRCVRTIRAALDEIGDLAAVLEAWADGHRGSASGERVSSRRTTAPSPSPITDTLDELYGMLATVETQWREVAGHRPRPNRARSGDARERTLKYLLEQLDRIMLHPGSVGFGADVLGWRRHLQKATRTDPVVRRRPGRCPRCGCVNTLATRDDAYTECRSCGRLMTEQEYETTVIGVADGAVVAESKRERGAPSWTG